MSGILIDIKSALRSIQSRVGLSVLIVLTLALGLSANFAVIAVAHRVLWLALPYNDPAHLIWFYEMNPKTGERTVCSIPNILDWQKRATAFQDLGIAHFAQYKYAYRDNVRLIDATSLSPNLLRMIGTKPALGHWPAGADETEVMLSTAFWRDSLGARPDVVGNSLLLNGKGYRIAGVMPSDFQFPPHEFYKSQLWTILPAAETKTAVNRSARDYLAIGRLQPGVSLAKAQAQMLAISRDLERLYSQEDQGWAAFLISVPDETTENSRALIMLFVYGVVFLTVVTISNTAALILAGSLSRARDVSARWALGATRLRLMAPVFMECLILSTAAGAAGTLASVWGSRAFASLLPDDFPRIDEVSIDPWTALIAGCIALGAGCIIGGFTSWFATRPALTAANPAGSRAFSLGKRTKRTFDALVVTQVAVASAVLLVACFMVRSLSALERVPLGFDANSVLTQTLSTGAGDLPVGPKMWSFLDSVLEKVGALAGVQSAAVSLTVPLGGRTAPTELDFLDGSGEQRAYGVDVNVVSSSYLNVFGIRLLKGRPFTAADSEHSIRVAHIAASVADAISPNGQAIGKAIAVDGVRATVVGIVNDVRQHGAAGPTTPLVYIPYRQIKGSSESQWSRAFLYLSVKCAKGSAVQPRSLARAIWDSSAEVPVIDAKTLGVFLASNLAPQKSCAEISACLAGVSCILALLGVYGAFAFHARQRSLELAIRMALGATLLNLSFRALRDSVKLSVISLSTSVVIVTLTERWWSQFLFGTDARDSSLFVAVGVLIAVLCSAAAVVPILGMRRRSLRNPISRQLQESITGIQP